MDIAYDLYSTVSAQEKAESKQSAPAPVLQELVEIGSAEFFPDESRQRVGIASGWNNRFQTILESAERTQNEAFEKYHALARVAVDFVEAAKTYGRVIISELFLPPDQRSIHCTNVGGTAGGDKVCALFVFDCFVLFCDVPFS